MVAAAYTPLLDDAEKLSVADLRSLQFDRLRWSIGHAFDKCAPYRALCESAGVGPADLTAPADVAALFARVRAGIVHADCTCRLSCACKKL